MYEYKAVRWKANWADNFFEEHDLTSSDAESLENLCNLYGANGWELIQIKERHYHGYSGKISILIFKRPLKKQHGNDTRY